MKFVAPEQAPNRRKSSEIRRSGLMWTCRSFRSVMRTDGTVTQPRLKQVALSAISEVKRRAV
ncbi:capsid completion protein [Escherichia coli]|nr:capsid completion protein [Escherichia coli]